MSDWTKLTGEEREIKFRVWVHNPDNIHEGEWIEYGWIAFNGKEINIDGDVIDYPDDSIKLMRYTGRKDKNGKEIYEDDIVMVYDIPVPLAVRKGTVKMVDGCWVVVGKTFIINLYGRDRAIEIIGNVYENPELIEK